MLPLGVEYAGSVSNSTSGTAPDLREQPEVVTNYMNTGRTALIYRYGDVSTVKAGLVADARYLLDTTLYAQQGGNKIDSYFFWDNMDQIQLQPGKVRL